MDRVLLRRHEPDRPDEIKGDENIGRNATMELEDPEVTKNFYKSVKKMDMTVPAYFKYFQCQATKDAEDHRGWTGLLQLPLVLDNEHRDCACLFQLFTVPDNEGYGAHHEIPDVAEHQGHEVCCTHRPGKEDGYDEDRRDPGRK